MERTAAEPVPDYVGRDQKLPLGVKLAYGAPNFAGASMAIPIAIHMSIFYSDVVLLPLGYIALAMAVARAFDAELHVLNVQVPYGPTSPLIDSFPEEKEARDQLRELELEGAKVVRALERGIAEKDVRLACYQNALDAYGQSGQISEDDWLNPPPIDQRTLYEGNSILRGGREPRVEEPKLTRSMEELIIE